MSEVSPLFEIEGNISYRGAVGLQRLEVDHRYIQLIAFLQNSQILKTKQLETVFKEYFGYNLNSRTIRRRLTKFVEYELLFNKKLDYGVAAPDYNIYRLGERGVELLYDNRLLPTLENSHNLYQLFSKSNFDHYLATQEILIRTLIGAKDLQTHADIKDGMDYRSLKSIKPTTDPFIDSANNVLIMPDWRVKTKESNLLIECDSGTEVQRDISWKVARYITLAKQRPNEDHSVLFGIIDRSFPTRINVHNNRQRRVSNLKQLILDTPGFINENLHFLVISMERTKFVSPRTLMLNPLTLENRQLRMKVFYRALKRENTYPFIKVDHSDSYSVELSSKIESFLGFSPDFIVREKEPNTHDASATTSVYFMLREGEVGGLKRLSYFCSEEKRARLRDNGIEVDRVFGVYYEHEEVINDVVPVKCDNKVYFSSIKSLNRPTVSTGLYRRLSPTRVDEVGKYELD